MKRIIYIAIIAVAIVFQSCLKEDDDLFDKTASVRMTETIESYRTELTSTEFGWALEYYPEEKQSYGGCMYAIQFTADSAKVSIDLAKANSTESSLYNIVADNGPVLTFDTYNTFLHYFATPSSSSTDGKRGDYEFILMAQKGDSIVLKGKKTGNRMVMYKLKESRETFIDKVRASKAIFSAVPKVSTTINGTTITTGKTAAKLSFSYKEGEEDVEISVAYLATPTGIKLYKPVTINGITFQELDIDADEKGLTSKNGDVKVQFVWPPINEVFSATNTQWQFTFDDENMSASLKAAWDYLDAYNASSYGETVNWAYIGANIMSSSAATVPTGFAVNSSGYFSIWGLSMSPVENTTDRISIEATGKSANNASFYGWFELFVDEITDNSPYIMECDDEKNPTEVKFTSVSNPSVWFVVAQ